MKRLVVVGMFFTCALPAAALAAAEPSADEILKWADHSSNNFRDLSLESQMLIFDPGATTGREARFETITKGEKRLVRFIAPADSKGMAMLVEGRDTMYVYLPGFQKVRRLGTHAKNQSFMGSDVSNEDMAENHYSGIYQPKLVGGDDKAWILELTLVPGKEAEFPKLKLWVDKSLKAVTQVESYDPSGNKAKTQVRSDFKKDEGQGEHQSPLTVIFTDHRRNDHRTEMHFSKVKQNQGVADDVFSQRSLVRGQ